MTARNSDVFPPPPLQGRGSGGGGSPAGAASNDRPHPNPSPEGEGLSDARFSPAALLLCGLAARVLGWRPCEFWASTPAELAAALGLQPPGADPGIDRETLQRLMERDHG